MTPSEIEQFAALRMQVAHLHNALGVARMAIEQGLPATAVVAANGPTIAQVVDRALAESQGDVAELLRDAARDVSLEHVRVQLEGLTRAHEALGHVHAVLVERARHAVLVGPGEAEASLRDLEAALP